MARTEHDGLWVSDDGSWGNGEVIFVDMSKWTKQQRNAFEKLTDEFDEIYPDDIITIDNLTNK